MQSNTQDEKVNVYEIGFVFVSSIPQEKVAGQYADLKDALAKAGASVIAEEAPEMRSLAYTMVKKMHGANQRFTEGYFGWVKFEMASNAIETAKKYLDSTENVLRYLLITTVKENTYLGKKAPAFAGERDGIIAPEGTAPAAPVAAAEVPAVTEDMDKSIDAMVTPGTLAA